MNRDPELEALLEKFRKVNASEKQIAGWESAVAGELVSSQRRLPSRWRRTARMTAQMAAMLLLGFFLGIISKPNTFFFGEKNEPAATIQYVYSKSE